MRLLSLLSVLGAVAALSACGGDDSGGGQSADGKTDVIRLDSTPTAGVAPIYVGMERGFFAKHRIRIKPNTGTSGATIIPAVVKGDVQIGFGNTVSSVIARARGVPIKIVGQGVVGARSARESVNQVMVKDPSIRTPADLAGKKVAVSTLRNFGEVSIRGALEKQGANADDIDFVELDFPDMPAALDQGRVDAAWMVEPFVSQARGQGARPLFSNDVAFSPGLSLASYFTSDRFATENRDVLDRFLAGLDESLEYTSRHPEAARKAVPTFTEIPPPVAAKMTLPSWSTDLRVPSIELQARFAEKYGFAKERPATGELVYERKDG